MSVPGITIFVAFRSSESYNKQHTVFMAPMSMATECGSLVKN